MSSFDSMLSRRQLLRVGAVSTAVSVSGWLGKLAMAAEAAKTKPKRACILLWMNGGPSQLDTFDIKTDQSIQAALVDGDSGKIFPDKTETVLSLKRRRKRRKQ